MTLEVEMTKLFQTLEQCKYPVELKASIHEIIKSEKKFTVIQALISQIIPQLQFCLFPIYHSFLINGGVDPSIRYEQKINVMFNTLVDLLNYQPKIQAGAFYGELRENDKFAQLVVYHMLRTVRIYSKLLFQLNQRWISISSTKMMEKSGFVVLLPPILQKRTDLAQSWSQPVTQNHTATFTNKQKTSKKKTQFVDQWELQKQNLAPLTVFDPVELKRITKQATHGQIGQTMVDFTAIPKENQERIKAQFLQQEKIEAKKEEEINLKNSKKSKERIDESSDEFVKIKVKDSEHDMVIESTSDDFSSQDSEEIEEEHEHTRPLKSKVIEAPKRKQITKPESPIKKRTKELEDIAILDIDEEKVLKNVEKEVQVEKQVQKSKILEEKQIQAENQNLTNQISMTEQEIMKKYLNPVDRSAIANSSSSDPKKMQSFPLVDLNEFKLQNLEHKTPLLMQTEFKVSNFKEEEPQKELQPSQKLQSTNLQTDFDLVQREKLLLENKILQEKQKQHQIYLNEKIQEENIKKEIALQKAQQKMQQEQIELQNLKKEALETRKMMEQMNFELQLAKSEQTQFLKLKSTLNESSQEKQQFYEEQLKKQQELIDQQNLLLKMQKQNEPKFQFTPKHEKNEISQPSYMPTQGPYASQSAPMNQINVKHEVVIPIKEKVEQKAQNEKQTVIPVQINIDEPAVQLQKVQVIEEILKKQQHYQVDDQKSEPKSISGGQRLQQLFQRGQILMEDLNKTSQKLQSTSTSSVTIGKIGSSLQSTDQ